MALRIVAAPAATQELSELPLGDASLGNVLVAVRTVTAPVATARPLLERQACEDAISCGRIDIRESTQLQGFLVQHAYELPIRTGALVFGKILDRNRFVRTATFVSLRRHLGGCLVAHQSIIIILQKSAQVLHDPTWGET